MNLFLLNGSLSFHSTIRTHVVVDNVVENTIGPRQTLWKGGVELGGNGLEQGKLAPRYGREIMMFIVVSDILGHHVEYAVVGEGLVVWVCCVVLGNKVSCQRVKAASKKGRSHQEKIHLQ